MKKLRLSALLSSLLLAISCTGTLSVKDTILPDNTPNATYYSTAVVGVGTDNHPAILAQRSIKITQPDAVFAQPDLYRQELVLFRTDDVGKVSKSFLLNKTDRLYYSRMHLQPTSDGGFVALYTTENELSWQLCRISPEWTVVWNKPLNPFPAVARLYSMLIDKAGSIYVGGYFYRGQGGPVACIAKLTAQGDVVWAKDYANLPGNGSYGYTLTLTPEGGCLLSGKLFPAAVSFPQNSFLLKTDTEGGIIWSKTYSMPAITAHCSFADGYLLAGQTITTTDFPIYLSKTFADGTPQWFRGNLMTGFYNMPVYLFADKDRYTVLGNGSTPIPTPSNGFLSAQFDVSGNLLSRVVSPTISGTNLNENGLFQNIVDWTGHGYLTASKIQVENDGLKLSLVGYDGQLLWNNVVAKSIRP